MDPVLVRIMDIVSGAELSIVDGDSSPRTATLTVTSQGRKHCLRLVGPTPLDALVEIFGNCYEIRLIDQNANRANSLEFGRYRLEIRDEDGTIAHATADTFEIINL